MRRILFISTLVLFILTGTVWAKDMVATWKYSDGSIVTWSIRDDDHVRMDTNNDSYTLYTGGKTYLVTRGDDGWTARDMDKLSGMMGGMFGPKKVNIDDYKTTYDYLKKKETIAGYKGKVYRVKVQDASGKQISSDEVVLSTNEDIVRINKAMSRIGSKMTGMDVSQEALKKQAKKYGGTLRYGNGMTLVSVKKLSLKDSHYELPEAGTTASNEDQSSSEQTGSNKKSDVKSLFKSIFNRK